MSERHESARQIRARRLGHRGGTVWLTGLSGSGKSTIAAAAEQALALRNVLTYRLDGDDLRGGLCADLGFSPEHRAENIRRAGEVARLVADAGLVVLASFISPYAEGRDRARASHAAADLAFVEVHVDCPLEVVEQRDTKGLYRKARAGQMKGLTGVDAPYERPRAPELRLRTDELSVDEEVARIVEALDAAGVLRA
jgi:adenylylsulfate kinase